MNKSEGQNKFADFFGKTSENVAKMYKISQLRLSLATFKKSRKEKIAALGERVYALAKKDSAIEINDIKEFINAIAGLEVQIAEIEDNIDKLKNRYAESSTADLTPEDLGADNTSKDNAEPANEDESVVVEGVIIEDFADEPSEVDADDSNINNTKNHRGRANKRKG